jgi:hypothetical protein
MAKTVIPKEFSLVAACCRWPLADAVCADIRCIAQNPLDWDYVVRISERQRVGGLVHNALGKAGVAVPEKAWRQLSQRRHTIVRQNLASAAEGLRLQRRFEDAGIRLLTIKGIPLAVRAYGSIDLKQSRDIDLLVAPGAALAALRLLEVEGYVLTDPAEKLDDWQREAYVARGYEMELRRPADGRRLELHWRLTENPLLLRDWGSELPDHGIPVPGGSVRTLPDEDLFCYLAVHGATHRWFRLKWLADFNAVIAAHEAGDLVRLYRRADAIGAGRSAAQALSLCETLLGRELPAALVDELSRERGLGYLVRRARRAMLMPDPGVEPRQNVSQTLQNLVDLFLAGKGFAFYRAQCALTLVGPHDVIAFRLPAALAFLYPVLRVPFWFWRRAVSRFGPLPRAG